MVSQEKCTGKASGFEIRSQGLNPALPLTMTLGEKKKAINTSLSLDVLHNNMCTLSFSPSCENQVGCS